MGLVGWLVLVVVLMFFLGREFEVGDSPALVVVHDDLGGRHDVRDSSLQQLS